MATGDSGSLDSCGMLQPYGEKRKNASQHGKKSQHKDGYTRYLKRPVLEETDTPNPIQGPVKDANELYHFMKDVHDSMMPKMWGIFLNADYMSVGNEPLALGEHANPDNFHPGVIYRFHYLFGAKRFVLLTNHTSDDAAPTEADRRLIQILQTQAQLRVVSTPMPFGCFPGVVMPQILL